MWSGPSVTEVIAGEESSEVEFKQTGIGHQPQSGKPQFPSDNVIKTVAAFLNSSTGGTLAIGISGGKRIIVLDADFQSQRHGYRQLPQRHHLRPDQCLRAGPVTLHTRARPEQIAGK